MDDIRVNLLRSDFAKICNIVEVSEWKCALNDFGSWLKMETYIYPFIDLTAL